MGQEFVIKSSAIEDKINQLLPTQGGYQPGVDCSASTTIIPVVDLTETASGSLLREHLQNAISFTGATGFIINNTTQQMVNTTGYYRVFGSLTAITSTTAVADGRFIISDGATDKIVWRARIPISSNNLSLTLPVDFIAFLEAGETLKGFTANANIFLCGSTRQIASIDGQLTNP